LNPVHYEALTAFLQRAALALQNARLYEQLQAQVEELRSLHSQIVRAERLAALGELAAKVAHELNNPLTAIHLYSSLLLEEPVDAAEQRRLAAVTLEQAERAKQVVRDILDYSRPTEPKLELAGLNVTIESSLRLVRHVAHAARVSIIEDYAGSLPAVRVDVGQMAQVCTNLALNAIQAMSNGGTLIISTGTHDDLLYVAFKDNGSGISPEHLARVFEPFFTTKPAGEGTGLGLAVCRSLALQQHGRLTVESEVGKGSTFTLWLPPAPSQEGMIAGPRPS
jgi:two-component system NtrC family sensor kinase